MSQNSVRTDSLPVPHPDSIARLRDALRSADFTADGCLDLLGATAYAALSRGETVPALRATRADGPLQTLVRLFLLQQPVTRRQAAAALPLDDCLADGWLQAKEPEGADGAEGAEEAGAVRATVDVRPYAGPDGQDWWIVADLGCGVGGAAGIGSAPAEERAGLVLGVGGASTTLAGITIRTPADSVLDLGTGCGVQALHATAHATRVVATDVNPRALRIARLTFALSGAPEPDLRQGSLFEPVGEGPGGTGGTSANGETFDLIVSNPPFVISPGERFVYRDGGMAGDDLCRTIIERAPRHLTDGGFCQLLANWQHVDGEDWRERVSSWVPRGCDAWIVQREVQDPAQYAELWLRDGGDHRGDPAAYAVRYEAWLEEFERLKVKAIGFGWITLRACGSDRPVVIAEEWPHPVEQPLGAEIRRWFERQDFLRTHDDASLLAARFRLADEVVQEQVGLPGAEDPEHVVLRSNRGMRRATKVDTVGAGFAGVCDGSLPAGRIVDAIAQLLGEDPVVLRDRTPASIRLLVEQGFLEPVNQPVS
ncbi:class I SAM-dependent methyltransferase [Streptomyces sp. RB6PN25]|uniref:Class I SAM-dependent methyltransferase n=1 Tax=Streptomyces humicola TaxID=2953240 RepID=A0ABT1PTZ9_9ACTN|nr:class I SAM-dependent methyltransferase [Streptomyces humicola]MCQ4081146.1 class I SAM-dependent methyltransferase [Streptomyces humicola]